MFNNIEGLAFLGFVFFGLSLSLPLGYVMYLIDCKLKGIKPEKYTEL